MRTPQPAALDATAAGHPTRFDALDRVPVDEALIRRLHDACARVDADDGSRVEAGRDWWPLSTVWAVAGTAPALPAVVARPSSAAEVASVLAVCDDARVPVTAFAGTSGVCGGSVPVFGGVSLDLTGLAGIVEVDRSSLLVRVRAGTFGDRFEDQLRSDHGLTLGHWPQSMALSTVGGWVACRGAGQYSTRYGKIEDMVAGLEVVLADGRVVRTGTAAPRAATGPDLNQLFVGSEGTLGIITEATLRVHPAPAAERRAAYGFPSFAEGLDACRRVLRRGATPAVLRLYDPQESARQFDLEDTAALIVIDEGDPLVIGSAMEVVAEECAPAAQLDPALPGRWLEHRNSLPALESLVRAGIVADTVEVAASWRALPGIYEHAVEELMALEGTLAASAHQSHAYPDGACLYFTFAGRPAHGTTAAAEAYYRRAFDAVTEPTVRAGGAISHHHGIGLNRGPYMRDQLGPAFEILQSVKDALDPRGILNPGKLGLSSPFGEGPRTP
ncbi:MAG TPA: FAD-binding oxidoreductase [Acidimicrobiales bacterium]|nr:FAD-binding oxidoreductase [Acidimicrobiales bacterium]